MIILTTTSKRVLKIIQLFKEGQGQHKPHKELFIEHYGLGSKNNKSMSFVMKDDGVAWSYAASLKKKYPDEVTIFYAKDLWFHELPELFQEAGTWLAEKPRNIKHLPKAFELTEEELKSVKLEDLKTFFKFKGKSPNQDTLDKIKSNLKKRKSL